MTTINLSTADGNKQEYSMLVNLPIRGPYTNLTSLTDNQQIEDWLFTNYDSYERMEVLLDLYHYVDREIFFKVLGSLWSASDKISAFKDDLEYILAEDDTHYYGLMMTDDEKLALSKLPEEITIYRGCYPHNMNGLSWTTDLDTAVKFTSMNRYTHADLKPLVMTSSILRKDSILLLERGENEIIAPEFLRQGDRVFKYL